MPAEMRDAVLVLRDGRVFRGRALGAVGETDGEVIFNTAMSGYQEILTDPSYRGQIVTMTYPMIGNYGLNEEDVESHRPWANGLIVKEASVCPSSWRGRVSLDAYLKTHGLVGLQGIDTRALTRHLRDAGAQDGIISSADLDVDRLRDKARALPGLVGRDLVAEVTAAEPFTWKTGEWDLAKGYRPPPPARFNVVAFDAGIKFNILRQLRAAGCDVTVVPAGTPAEAVLERKPHGVFLSNGPGDPEGVPYLIDSVRALLRRVPVFGICLGHQIRGLAGSARRELPVPPLHGSDGRRLIFHAQILDLVPQGRERRTEARVGVVHHAERGLAGGARDQGARRAPHERAGRAAVGRQPGGLGRSGPHR